jgi:hypothetical protein
MRELKCKVGDLAIVTKCGVPGRIGLLVCIVGRSADGIHDWLTELQGPGIVARSVVTGKLARRTRALMYDWNLTPVRGGELVDEQHEESASRRTYSAEHSLQGMGGA